MLALSLSLHLGFRLPLLQGGGGGGDMCKTIEVAVVEPPQLNPLTKLSPPSLDDFDPTDDDGFYIPPLNFAMVDNGDVVKYVEVLALGVGNFRLFRIIRLYFSGFLSYL
ncbi:unnamed protein product [Camellia sinensis]